jgi:hypothetical protein
MSKNQSTEESKKNLHRWECERRNQELTLTVVNSEFKVQSLGPWYLSLDCITASNVKAHVSFEILDPFVTPKEFYSEPFASQWGTIPEWIDGHFEGTNSWDGDRLKMQLYLSKKSTDPLLHTLSYLNSPNSKVSVHLEIAYPREIGKDFWELEWRGKPLIVQKWRLDARSIKGF